MKRQMSIFIVFIMFLTILDSNIVVNSQARSKENYIHYENTTDFVCGFSNTDEAVTNHEMFIIFRNSNDFPVMLNNYLKLSDEVMVKPELNEKYLNVLISPNRDFRIDCQYIYDMFYQDMAEKKNLEIFNGNIRSKNMGALEIAMDYTSSSRFKSDIAQKSGNEIN